MSKKIAQKNSELLLVQQRTELNKLKESMPLDLIRAAEDKLLLQCAETLEGLLDFSVIGFDSEGKVDKESLPFEWGLLSPNERARKIRLAKYACLPTCDIPHGAKLAHATYIGIIKARAKESSGTRILNLEVSQFPAPAPLKDSIDADFEVIDLE